MQIRGKEINPGGAVLQYYNQLSGPIIMGVWYIQTDIFNDYQAAEAELHLNDSRYRLLVSVPGGPSQAYDQLPIYDMYYNGRWYYNITEAQADTYTNPMVEQKAVRLAYPEFIMKDVREHLGLEPYDTSRDSDIASMSKGEILEHVTEWDGLLGYRYKILGWIDAIYGTNLSNQ